MKIQVNYKEKSETFDFEENNTTIHETFGVLHAFILSTFDSLPEPFVLSWALESSKGSVSDPQQLEDAIKKFAGRSIVVLVVEPSDGNQEEDSFEVIYSPNKVDNQKKVAVSDEKMVIEDKKDKEEELADKVIEMEEEPVIEDQAVMEEEPVIEDQAVMEEEPIPAVEEEPVKQGQKNEEKDNCNGKKNCKARMTRVVKFLTEVGSEKLNNLLAVVYSLLENGNDVESAVLGGLSATSLTSHPFIQEHLHLLSTWGLTIGRWIPFMLKVPLQTLQSMVPKALAAMKACSEGKTGSNCEMNMRPFFCEAMPNLISQFESTIPGQERVFPVDFMNPFGVVNQLREHVAEHQQAAEPENKPKANGETVHHGVICDGCGQDPIVGIRYKSMAISNFDLCEKCEPDHPHNVLKIRQPETEARNLVGLKEYSMSVLGPMFRRWRGGRGGRGRCFGWRGGVRRGRNCPFKPYGGRCNQRRNAPQPSAPMNDVNEIHGHLRQAQNEAKELKQTFKEKKREVKNLKKQAKQAKKEMKRQEKKNKFNAEIADHIELGPREVVVGNTCVEKIWRVHNCGSVAWDRNTVAVFVKGSKDMVVEEVLHIGEVNVDGHAMVHCMLNIPATAGTYTVHYRLHNGIEFFGKPLWTTVVVEQDVPIKENSGKVHFSGHEELLSAEEEDSMDSAVVEENLSENMENMVLENVNPSVEGNAPVEEKASFKHEKQLSQIKELGFKISDETLKAVLNVSRGDLEEALRILTQQHRC